MSNNNDSQATTVFVLGLLGLTVCNLCAPIAWVMGNNYVRECAMEGVDPNGLGVAGRIMGMIGSILLVIGLAFLVLYIGCIIFAVGGGAMSGY